MPVAEVQISIPEDILYTLNLTRQEFARDTLYSAFELYRHHRMSMGKAAALAGMAEIDFLFQLGQNGIPAIDYDRDDFNQELESLSAQ